jgi:DNA polymerase-3 subunit beta
MPSEEAESSSPIATATPPFRATVTREALSGALAAVLPTIGRGSEILPILASVKLTLVPGGMTATSNSLEQTTTVQCLADHDAIGAVCLVPARKLAEIARELPPAPVNLSLTNGKFTLECSRTRYVIPTIADAREFPNAPVVTGPSRMFPAASLHELAKHVAYAASTEESRPALRGVHLELETEGRTTAVATNGHRLAVARQAGEAGGDGSVPSVTIPTALLDQATRLFAADEMLTLTVDTLHNQLALAGARGSLTSRLIDIPYPQWRQVVPTDNDIVATVDTMALVAAIKRVATVASDQTHRVKIRFEPGMAKISAQTPDIGDSTDEVPIEYHGEPLEIGFNAAYLLEHLAKIGSAETQLLLKSPERAIRVLPGGAETEAVRVKAAASGTTFTAGHESAVMPLRLLD